MRRYCYLLSVITLVFLFSSVTADNVRHDVPISSLTKSNQPGGALYASLDGKGAFIAESSTSLWKDVNKGLWSTRVLYIQESPFDVNTVYVGTKGNGLYVSHDRGNTWSALNEGLTNTSVSQLVFNPVNDNELYSVTMRGGVYKSIDRGLHWTSFNEGLSLGANLHPAKINVFYKMIYVPEKSGVLFLGTRDGLYKRKIADDKRWVTIGPLNKQVVNGLVFDGRDRTLYASANRQLFSSVDIGEHWTKKGMPMQSLIKGLAIAGADSDLYAIVAGRGLLRSQNHGKSWQEANNGLPGNNIVSLINDLDAPKTLYAGLWGFGLYVSRDNGDFWQPMNNGIPGGTRSPPEPRNIKRKNHKVVSVPDSFKKCNVCHGWEDKTLNSVKNVSFYVTGTKRDWEFTVKRMNEEEKWALSPENEEVLTPDEEREVIHFLSSYY